MDKTQNHSYPKNDRITSLVNELRKNPSEGSWFEFKTNLSNKEKIGQLISGLANSATLARVDHGYLIWGVG